MSLPPELGHDPNPYRLVLAHLRGLLRRRLGLLAVLGLSGGSLGACTVAGPELLTGAAGPVLEAVVTPVLHSYLDSKSEELHALADQLETFGEHLDVHREHVVRLDHAIIELAHIIHQSTPKADYE